MAEYPADLSGEASGLKDGRFGAGLTEAEVRRFQIILREQCGAGLGLPEAWSRAIELLSLVEMLLRGSSVHEGERAISTGFALPRS